MQAQLVRHAISLLTEKGFTVHAVTCDGSFTNQSTAQQLGCNVDINGLKATFPHPGNREEEINFIF